MRSLVCDRAGRTISKGGVQTFNALSTKAKLLEKLGRKTEGEKALQTALDNATANELHVYGRQLIGEKKS